MQQEYGVDLTGHRSALISLNELMEATHIYCMAPRHLKAILAFQRENFEQQRQREQQQQQRQKVAVEPAMVSVFEPEIPDPWHGTIQCYRECSEMLDTAVSKAMDELRSKVE